MKGEAGEGKNGLRCFVLGRMCTRVITAGERFHTYCSLDSPLKSRPTAAVIGKLNMLGIKPIDHVERTPYCVTDSWVDGLGVCIGFVSQLVIPLMVNDLCSRRLGD